MAAVQAWVLMGKRERGRASARGFIGERGTVERETAWRSCRIMGFLTFHGWRRCGGELLCMACAIAETKNEGEG